MKLLKTLSIIAFFFTSTISFAQNTTFDCKKLKSIKLRYVENIDKTAYILIKNNKHIEFFEGQKYFIKSDLKWINDCEYIATMTEITVPDFPFKVGESMNVKFEKIAEGFIYGTATVQGNNYPLKFEIVK